MLKVVQVKVFLEEQILLTIINGLTMVGVLEKMDMPVLEDEEEENEDDLLSLIDDEEET